MLGNRGIVDVEIKFWTADWLLMLVVILIRWIVHHSAYHILQRRSLSLGWRLDREMRRWLILDETGFTRERVFTPYFNEVDTVYLFLNWLNTRVSDDRKYVCGRRLYACTNTRKFKGLDSREITSLPEIKKVIYMARHFNHRITREICIQWKFATPDYCNFAN